MKTVPSKAFLVALVVLAGAGVSRLGAAPLDLVPEIEVREVVTAEGVAKGLRRGLFEQVIEYGPRVLADEPDAPIKGAMAVALAVQDRGDESAAFLEQAEMAGEPEVAVHRLLGEAILQRNRGDTGKASAMLEAFLQSGDDHPVARLFLAEIASAGNDLERALDESSNALELEPRMSPAYLIRGTALLAKGETERAQLSFRNAIITDPRDLRPRLAMARISLSAGAHRAAAAMYRDVLSMKGDLLAAREGLMLALYEGRQMDEALEIASGVLDEHAENSAALLTAGKAKAWAGELEAAGEFLSRYIAKNPEAPEGHYLQGLCAAARGDFDSAARCMGEAIERAGADSGYAAALGVLQHVQGERDEAATTLRGALGEAPQGVADRIHFHLAALALDRRDWDEASRLLRMAGSFVVNLKAESLDLESLYAGATGGGGHLSLGALFLAEGFPASSASAFRKASAANPSDALALFIGSNAFAQRLEFAEAQKDLDRLTTLLPSYWPARFAAGYVAVSRGDKAAAIEAFERVRELDPSNETAHRQLIALYRAEGRVDEAVEVCTALINRAPSSPFGHHVLATLLLEEGRDLDTALGLATRAVELDPKNGAHHDTLGWVMVQQGEIEGSLPHLRRAFELSPRSSACSYHLGVALLRLGKEDEGKGYLGRAAALGGAAGVEAKAALKAAAGGAGDSR